MTQGNADTQIASELLQILADVFQRFPHVVSGSQTIQSNSLAALVQILTSARPSIRKRAIPALSALIATNPTLFDAGLKDKLVQGLSAGGDDSRTWSGLMASLARGASAQGVGAAIAEGQAVDAVLSQTENMDDTDAVEGALVVSCSRTSSCPFAD